MSNYPFGSLGVQSTRNTFLLVKAAIECWQPLSLHFFLSKQNLLLKEETPSPCHGVGVGLDGVPHWRLLWDVHLGDSFWDHALHPTEVY